MVATLSCVGPSSRTAWSVCLCLLAIGVCLVAERRRARRSQLVSNEFVPVYYINMDVRTDRRQRLERQLEKRGVAATRVRALTGNEVPTHIVGHEWDTTLNSTFDRHQVPHKVVALSPGERGCAGSHVHVWKRALAQYPQTPVLILEDDAVLTTDFKNKVNAVLDLGLERTSEVPCIVYLEYIVGKWGTERHITDLGTVVQRVHYSWNTGGYLVWPDTLRLVLAHLPIHDPVDNFLARLNHDGKIAAYACRPRLVRQFCTQCDGNIEHTLR